MPGLADPDLPIEKWVEEIRNKISPQDIIDMALMVIKSTDFRMNVEQIMVAKAMKKFLENLQPKSTFLVITHCDKKDPDAVFIKNKLESIKKYCGLEIPVENVVKFQNSADSLVAFVVDKFVEGKIHIVEEKQEEVKDLKEEIQVSAK